MWTGAQVAQTGQRTVVNKGYTTCVVFSFTDSSRGTDPERVIDNARCSPCHKYMKRVFTVDRC